MNIEEMLYAILSNDTDVVALVSTRIYPLFVPQDATRPAIAYQQISGPSTYSHNGNSGLQEVRFQLTCEGNTYSQANSVAIAAREALEGQNWRCVNKSDGWGDAFECPVKRLDFMKFAQE